jgi:signal transduction histidine kinase
MKASISLRARLLLGAALWTVGLFVAAGIVMTHVLFNNPHAPRIFHAPFTHIPIAAPLGLVCLLGGIWHVRRGLSPIRQLRSRLSEVHSGLQTRVVGRYPAEVQPLVDDLNALLDQRDAAVRRAQAKAGDLAHGLKTPLAVLANDAARARQEGHTEFAGAVTHEVDRMRRQIEYHLAQARTASGTPSHAHCQVRASAEGLARTLERLHAARGLAIDLDVPTDHEVRADRADLDEMLGNLLDNACKWATSRVSLTSTMAGANLILDIEDDGPGLPASQREVVLERGVRADEAAAGSGLGLAIVRELAELHGGTITLEAAPIGLRARLTLPRAK